MKNGVDTGTPSVHTDAKELELELEGKIVAEMEGTDIGIDTEIDGTVAEVELERIDTGSEIEGVDTEVEDEKELPDVG